MLVLTLRLALEPPSGIGELQESERGRISPGELLPPPLPQAGAALSGSQSRFPCDLRLRLQTRLRLRLPASCEYRSRRPPNAAHM
eukprot:11173159-Alexandrium_andersonii.AAC.1